MRAIIKYLIEYIFDVFVLIKLVMNDHRSRLIEAEVSVWEQHIMVHLEGHTRGQYMNVSYKYPMKFLLG